MVKLDGKRHLKAIKRQETGRFVSIGHRQRLFDSNKLFGGSLLLDARRLNQKHEWPSTAVHNRYFRGAELDNRVVDAQSRHSGQEVLHRRDFYVTLDQGGGQRGLRSEEHTSELQSRGHIVCRLLHVTTNHS